MATKEDVLAVVHEGQRLHQRTLTQPPRRKEPRGLWGHVMGGGGPAMQGQAAFSPGAANNTQEREKVRALAGKVQVLGGGGWGVVV